MLNLITKSISYLFPVGRTLKLIKNSVEVTKSTNPLILTKKITLTVIDCCTPPPVRLTAHYIGACALQVQIQLQLVQLFI